MIPEENHGKPHNGLQRLVRRFPTVVKKKKNGVAPFGKDFSSVWAESCGKLTNANVLRNTPGKAAQKLEPINKSDHRHNFYFCKNT